jgi:hypothetical protein
MLAIAHCVHSVPGRVRYRIPERRGDGEFFVHLHDVLGGHEGIHAVAVNAATASVLIHHGTGADAVAAAARASGLFEVVPMPNLTLGAQAAVGLRTADRGLNVITDGKVDMRTALFLGLTGLAIHQALKGHLLGPASTLIWYALATLKWNETKP